VTDDAKKNSQLVASWANFVAVCVAIGAILIYMGRKDQELATTTAQVRELSNIVSDLAKAQVGLTVKTQQNDDRFKELAARLERLERSRQ
jgi:hypothetical protein